MAIFRLPANLTNSRTHSETDTALLVLSNQETSSSHDFWSSSPSLVYCTDCHANVPVIVTDGSDSRSLPRGGFMLVEAGTELTFEMTRADVVSIISLGNDRLITPVDSGFINLPLLKDHLIYGGCGEHILFTTESGVISVLRLSSYHGYLQSEGPIWGVVVDGYCGLTTDKDTCSYAKGDGFLIEPDTPFKVTHASRCEVLAYRAESITVSGSLPVDPKLPVAGLPAAF